MTTHKQIVERINEWAEHYNLNESETLSDLVRLIEGWLEKPDERERRQAWDRYAATFIKVTKGKPSELEEGAAAPDYTLIAECADAMLAERDKRFKND
jgi:hypothetical protein